MTKSLIPTITATAIALLFWIGSCKGQSVSLPRMVSSSTANRPVYFANMGDFLEAIRPSSATNNWRDAILSQSPSYFSRSKLRISSFLALDSKAISERKNVLPNIAEVTLPKFVVLHRLNDVWYIPEFLYTEDIASRMELLPEDRVTAYSTKKVEQVFSGLVRSKKNSPIELRVNLSAFQFSLLYALREDEQYLHPFPFPNTEELVRLSTIQYQVNKAKEAKEARKVTDFTRYEEAVRLGNPQVVIFSRINEVLLRRERVLSPVMSLPVYGVKDRTALLSLFHMSESFRDGDQLELTTMDKLPFIVPGNPDGGRLPSVAFAENPRCLKKHQTLTGGVEKK